MKLPSMIAAAAATVALSVESLARAEVIVVQQVSFAFSPADVTASPGDTIRWVRTGGSHTVTSGSDCTEDGVFDGLLSASSLSFEWTVPAAASGTIPYFCAPHCFFDMVGTITIAAPAIPGDLDGSGAVDGADLAMLLGVWGVADPAADLDGSGLVGGGDLSMLLANWS